MPTSYYVFGLAVSHHDDFPVRRTKVSLVDIFCSPILSREKLNGVALTEQVMQPWSYSTSIKKATVPLTQDCLGQDYGLNQRPLLHRLHSYAQQLYTPQQSERYLLSETECQPNGVARH